LPNPRLRSRKTARFLRSARVSGLLQQIRRETRCIHRQITRENGGSRPGTSVFFDHDGFLFCNDRKKDLIKTSGGKYVAPQVIEGMITQSEFVEQAVIVGDKRKYVSALIVPDFERLRAWAKEQGIATSDRQELIADRRVVDLIKADVNRLTRELADYEKVKRIGLLSDEFSIDGGELTPTLK
jgi:long-chain acyl-CoA synthetase